MKNFTTFQNVNNSIQRAYQGAREAFTPVLKESRVHEGVLTPDEFIIAGDQLVFRCPTWSWAAGDPKRAKPYLPKDKQYLVTKNVPCMRRVAGLEKEYVKETEVEMNSNDGDDDGWLMTYETSKEVGEEEIETIDDMDGFLDSTNVPPIPPTLVQKREVSLVSAVSGAGEDSDEYADMEDFEDDNLIEDDGAMLAAPTAAMAGVSLDGATETKETKGEADIDSTNVIATRTYDLSISYDKYYQTPRVWLFGYDENSQPLSQKQVFEDIMQDYANRTVTMEAHPHAPGGILTASIHPCKHADVMKNIIGHLAKGGKVARTDQYMFVFLKFIQSIIPTMNYDFTFSIEVA
eukprot:g1339.t1